MNELLFYVADRNMAEAVGGLMDREQVYRILECRPFDFDSRRDIRVAAGQCDPGLYARADELLRPLAPDYHHCVVIVDEEWEGSPGGAKIQRKLREHLRQAGWPPDDALALVVRPEVDIWLWSDSPHTATALGWSAWSELRPALEHAGWLAAGQPKPARPKEAAEWALRHSPRRPPHPRPCTGASRARSRSSGARMRRSHSCSPRCGSGFLW